jgi:hypothetical protein
METEPASAAAPANASPEERLRQRRDSAMWTMVTGVGMMFLGSFGAAFAIGGAAMTVGGGLGAFWYGRRLRRLKGDPWHDPEIDAWEREHFGGS